MEIKLKKATEEDACALFDIQVAAFTPLLDKYRDYGTNPASEPIEKMLKRIHNPDGGAYKIFADSKLIGAIFISWKQEEQFRISPMFILSAYQGRGIAQQAMQLIEEMHPQAMTWELDTLLEEEGNCRLYEKMGYKRTGRSKKLNENATLISYKKYR